MNGNEYVGSTLMDLAEFQRNTARDYRRKAVSSNVEESDDYKDRATLCEWRAEQLETAAAHYWKALCRQKDILNQ